METPTGRSFVPNLYLQPSFGQITNDQAEDLFRQRLEAMEVIENYREAGNGGLPPLLRAIKSNAYRANCMGLNVQNEQRKLDNISHYLARIFFAMNPNLWDSYKFFEKRFLLYRLRDVCDSVSADKLAALLDDFNFQYELMPRDEYVQLVKLGYIHWDTKMSGLEANTKTIGSMFKVNFEHALQFVAKRSVSVKDGYALLTTRDIVSVICDAFENHLDEALKYASHSLPLNKTVQQMYANLSLVYQEFQEEVVEKKRKLKTEQNFAKNPLSINMLNIDEVAKKNYPPCMRHLHESLRKDNHLRHHGRLYLGAFMRAAGVDETEAMDFWRDEFTKKIPVDKFERDYKYNIRHLYGKEGHRKALSSFSCDKIIKDNAPGPADNHGCPFRHFDEAHLVTMLKKHNINEADIDSIKAFKEQKDFTRACCEYFKSVHGELPIEPIRNPAQYYYQSARATTMCE